MFSQFVGPPQPTMPRLASARCGGGLNTRPAMVGSAEREAYGVSHEEWRPWHAYCQRRAQRCLTRRSSGTPTARHQAREAVRVIIHLAGLAASRRRPLSSNVRRQRTPVPLHSVQRSSAEAL